ncbi:MAG: hypothetical protein IPO09_02350 [Anaeromyxobacter sp.]|nr:hypothetical protein [Anaeromyxobacter sp.]
MPGLIASTDYTSHSAQLCAADAAFGEVIDAVEWELVRTQDLTRYPVLANTPKGPIHYLVVPKSAVRPGLVVLFAFEVNGGERKVLLVDLAPHVPDEAENGAE